jgi:hypothetical protein
MMTTESKILRILLNRIKTPDGTILTSYNRHNYVEYKDTLTKEVLMVDGGTDYLRRNIGTYEELSVYDDGSHITRRSAVHWGTRGKDGKQPLVYKLLKDLDSDHIEAILKTQHQISEFYREIFKEELKYRFDEQAEKL